MSDAEILKDEDKCEIKIIKKKKKNSKTVIENHANEDSYDKTCIMNNSDSSESNNKDKQNGIDADSQPAPKSYKTKPSITSDVLESNRKDEQNGLDVDSQPYIISSKNKKLVNSETSESSYEDHKNLDFDTQHAIKDYSNNNIQENILTKEKLTKEQKKSSKSKQLINTDILEINVKNETNGTIEALQPEKENCKPLNDITQDKASIEEYLEGQSKSGKTKRKKSKSKTNGDDEIKTINDEDKNHKLILEQDLKLKEDFLDKVINCVKYEGSDKSDGVNESIDKNCDKYDKNKNNEKFNKEINEYASINKYDDIINKYEIIDNFKEKTDSENISKLNTEINERYIEKYLENFDETQAYDKLLETKDKIEKKLNSSNVDLDSFLNFDLEKYSTKQSYDNEKPKDELNEDSINSMNAEDLITSIRKKYNISDEPQTNKLPQQNNLKFKIGQNSDEFIEEILRSAEAEKEKMKQLHPARKAAAERPLPTTKSNAITEKQIAARNKVEEIERYMKKLANPVYFSESMIRNEDNEDLHQPQRVFSNNFVCKSAGGTRLRNSISFNDRALRDHQLEEREYILTEKINQVKDLVKKQAEVVENFGDTSKKLSEFEATIKEARNIGQQRRVCFDELEEGFDSICEFYQQELNSAQESIARQKHVKDKSRGAEMNAIFEEFVSYFGPRKSSLPMRSSAARFQNEGDEFEFSNVLLSRRSSLTGAANITNTDSNYYKSNKSNDRFVANEISNEKLKREYDKILNDDLDVENGQNNGKIIRADDNDFINKIKKKYNLQANSSNNNSKLTAEDKYPDDLNSNIIKFNEELNKAISNKYSFPEAEPASSNPKYSHSNDYKATYSRKYSDQIGPASSRIKPIDNSDHPLLKYSKFGDKTLKSTSRYSFDDKYTFDAGKFNNFDSVNDISRDVDFQESLRNLKQFTNELQSADSKPNRSDFSSRVCINKTLQDEAEITQSR